MRALCAVEATPEQLKLFSRIRPGVEVIRGAAGSGKTTTAILKLRSLLRAFARQKMVGKSDSPIRVLVLTYNRTLSGYIQDLVLQQNTGDVRAIVEVSTFSKWAFHALGKPTLLDKVLRKAWINELGLGLGYSLDFLEAEVDYLLGRFLPADLDQYTILPREGRGGTPRLAAPARRVLLDKVVMPYQARKAEAECQDWNDLAVGMLSAKRYEYDIVIVDEAQDFSANQIRAIMGQLSAVHAVVYVLDTVQRIYARGFRWVDVGITVRPDNSFRLENNYRNTRQIAELAASIVNGLPTDDDGTVPFSSEKMRDGALPIVVKGMFRDQVAFAVRQIESLDLKVESVAFLHVGWSEYLEEMLRQANLDYADLTRKAEWPVGDEGIAISTLYSAKGLEFDHVFILGLSARALPHGEGDEDENLIKLRRLLAMGIGRARKSVTLGYKPGEESVIVNFLDRAKYREFSV
ncbi:3'-5' exonuclease [Achromobacter xylosoxidans]|uniref:DNA 3'-5' helicase n=1 Tax=Alcaligenes xylosoxydans xylosoxydans TaxID=85698 RepID=A0A2L0PTW8_ALCXX|nr:3'-5' exonuclease [Achromobacter xylosoxidans]AUZ18145.1 DNA helicase [Achromobacter xylosoxidans]